MRISCKHCGRTHSTGETCALKPIKKRYNYNAEPTIKKFRGSALWKNSREKIIKRDSYCCRACMCPDVDNYGQPTYNSRDLQVHHIIPLVEDWSKRTDEDNLISLCPMHHAMAEQGEISRELLTELAEKEIIF